MFSEHCSPYRISEHFYLVEILVSRTTEDDNEQIGNLLYFSTR